MTVPRPEIVTVVALDLGSPRDGAQTPTAVLHRGYGPPMNPHDLRVGVTPWRRSITGPVPVGIVANGETVFAPPQPPYWALVVPPVGPWSMVAQAEVGGGSEALVLGGFYPLVQNGRSVARRYPGTSIRAARVSVGGRGEQLWFVTASGRPEGLTTEELAAVWLRLGAEWALNLDGGRSAYLAVPEFGLLPRRPHARRRGPIVLTLSIDRRLN